MVPYALDPLREVSTTFTGGEPRAPTHLELRLCTWDMQPAPSTSTREEGPTTSA